MPLCRNALAFLLLWGTLVSAPAAETPLPNAIAAPGETVVLTVQAEGAQVYECKAGADGKLGWAFREPIATLLADGKTVGRHYAGPSWEVHATTRPAFYAACPTPRITCSCARGDRSIVPLLRGRDERSSLLIRPL